MNFLVKGLANIKENRKNTEGEILNYFGAKDLEEAFQNADIKVDVIGFFAGAGTRWIESLKNSSDSSIMEKPRCLGEVENVLGFGSQKIPLGIYSLSPLVNLGRNVIIYSSHMEEINQKIIKPLNQKAEFFKQEIIPGKKKVSGHGDAMRQVSKILNKKYVLTYWSGTSFSRKTVLMSILFMEILNREGQDVSLLLPTTYADSDKDDLILDENNIPLRILHKKLRGDKIKPGLKPLNIGLKIYRRDDILKPLEMFEKILKEKKSYSSLNPNSNDEFALEHLDEELIKNKSVRILPICPIHEFALVKSSENLPAFLEATKKIIKEDKI